MSDHGAAIRSSIPEARPPGPRGHVAHEPRRALILPEPEADGAGSESGPSLPGRISAGAEQQRVKMRQRIARLGSSRPQTPALDPLFRIIRANHPKADLGLVERAYRKAERLHSGQTRKSGDAFITHPLAVTTILAELGMTEATLCAALLHDTVEDTDYTARTTDPRLRRGDRAAGRRLHQAGQGQVRRIGQVRDDPQDGRRDEQGHPGAGDQARRPAAQHADAALPAAGQAVPDRGGDAGDLRPSGASARHEHHQVGAGGPCPSAPCIPRFTTRSSG